VASVDHPRNLKENAQHRFTTEVISVSEKTN